MHEFKQNSYEAKFLQSSLPKIGLIALSTDLTIEQDFSRICRDHNVDIYVNRIPFLNPLNHENYLKMKNHLPDIAKNILPGENINCIAYGCTSGSIAIGEDIIANEIHKSKPNAYVTTPITAAIKAFTKLNIKRIAVLTPYPAEVNKTVFDYLKRHHMEIINFNSFNLKYDSEIANVDPQSVFETVKSLDLGNCDAVFVSCTALRIVEILQSIEDFINKPIISSNQAIIWDSLRSVNINNSIVGYGKLLEQV
jgi:maleate isomerase